jgi:hypothetical protein
MASKRASTLRERLQSLVEESKLWTAQMEQEKIGGKAEIVLRGKGPSITSDDGHKQNLTHPKVLMRVAMTPEGNMYTRILKKKRRLILYCSGTKVISI